MTSPFIREKQGIVLAADLSNLSDLRQLIVLGSQFKEVVAIKIGFTLALRYGLPSVVKTIREISALPIIYDHQKAATDIPQMGHPFSEACKESGVEGVIFFPQAGPKTLESFVEAAFKNELTPIVGLTMTHKAYLRSEGGFIDDSAPKVISKISIDAGVRNFVLPGTKTELLKEYSELLASIKPAFIYMPGIGSQGGSLTTAFSAVASHYPFAIIGSSIYKASNPKEALESFVLEVQK